MKYLHCPLCSKDWEVLAYSIGEQYNSFQATRWCIKCELTYLSQYEEQGNQPYLYRSGPKPYKIEWWNDDRCSITIYHTPTTETTQIRRTQIITLPTLPVDITQEKLKLYILFS